MSGTIEVYSTLLKVPTVGLKKGLKLREEAIKRIQKSVKHLPQGTHRIDKINFTENAASYKTTTDTPHAETLALFGKPLQSKISAPVITVKGVVSPDLFEEFSNKTSVDTTEDQDAVVESNATRPALARKQEDDFKHAVAALLTPSAWPVITALTTDYRSLVQAAREILERKAKPEWKAKWSNEPRSDEDPLLSSPQLKEVVATSTLSRLQRRYEVMLKNLDLPTGFTTKEQAREAGRLESTYFNLRKRRMELGLEAIPKDPRITEAHRLRVAFQRQERKQAALVPPRRGRPPKLTIE